jgi:hypothetical protein
MVVLRGKIKKIEESERMMGRTTRSHGRGSHLKTQSHGMALEASASCKHCKTRSTAGMTSQTDFGSRGMIWIGSMPKLTRTPGILMTYRDSRSALVVCSLSILSMCTRALSSSVNRSRPSGGCRSCSSSSSSIASCTTRSISYRQRKI